MTTGKLGDGARRDEPAAHVDQATALGRQTHEPAQALRERTDSCSVLAAGVVGEAMVALVLADAYRAKFGGDHIDEMCWKLLTLIASGSDGIRPDGLHGRRQIVGGRRACGRRAAGSLTATTPSRSSWGEPIVAFFEREGEQEFRRREEQVVLAELSTRRVRRTSCPSVEERSSATRSARRWLAHAGLCRHSARRLLVACLAQCAPAAGERSRGLLRALPPARTRLPWGRRCRGRRPGPRPLRGPVRRRPGAARA